MHTRREGDLFGFPGGDEALIEGADDGIVVRGGEGARVEDGADRRAAGPRRGGGPARLPPRCFFAALRRRPRLGCRRGRILAGTSLRLTTPLLSSADTCTTPVPRRTSADGGRAWVRPPSVSSVRMRAGHSPAPGSLVDRVA